MMYTNSFQQKFRNQSQSNMPEDEADNMHYKSDSSNLLSQLTYWWLNWLPILGYKRIVTVDDLGVLSYSHRARRIHSLFQQVYQQNLVGIGSSEFCFGRDL